MKKSVGAAGVEPAIGMEHTTMLIRFSRLTQVWKKTNPKTASIYRRDQLLYFGGRTRLDFAVNYENLQKRSRKKSGAQNKITIMAVHARSAVRPNDKPF